MYWSIAVIGASMKDRAVQESTNHKNILLIQIVASAGVETVGALVVTLQVS